MDIVGPLDPKLTRLHEQDKKRLKDLERKYPRAANDDLQKACLLWEMFYGGKTLCVVDCKTRDLQITKEEFKKMYGLFSGLEAGLSLCDVADQPNGEPTGFQIACHETAIPEIKAKLKQMGITEGEVHWVSESEFRDQFEAWKQEQQLRQKRQVRTEKRTQHKKVGGSTLKQGLFDLQVEQSKAHKDFLGLKNLDHYTATRDVLDELFKSMGDPDGNFISDFQSDGFHSRLFEIACYAYLRSQNFDVVRNSRPDFIATKKGLTVAIEAVTANPSVGRSADISFDITPPKLSLSEQFEKTTNEFPIRMGNALLQKLGNKYWLLPECRYLPLVLATGPFYEPGSILNIDDSLARYLYGGWDIFPFWVKHNGIYTKTVPIRSHTFDGRQLASNFFSHPSSEHVSAVVYSNTFTETKFVRMAIQDGSEPKFQAVRIGTALVRMDCDLVASEFEFVVGENESPVETWAEGVTIFHNPNAIHPLPHDFFESTNSYEIQGTKLLRSVKGFHPLDSFTVISPKS
jgi:hypothetical protein